MKKRFLQVTGLVMFFAIGLYCAELAIPKRDYFIDRVGELENVDHTKSESQIATHETVNLRSTTGLRVSLRVLRPALVNEAKLPVVIVAGGHRTGKDAVDLVGKPLGIAYAAIDYPYSGNHSPRGFIQSLRTVPQIQRAFIDTPPALSLALSWLLQQPWVDPNRVELVGASLGVPFAAVAGATDTRFSRVWLMHGGGDNVPWVAHVGRKRIPNDTLRRFAARTLLFFVYGNSFDTPRWIEEIAPRRVILVVANDDDYVPREAQQPLIDASSGEYVELIWAEGQHIKTGRQSELQQLLDVVVKRVAEVVYD